MIQYTLAFRNNTHIMLQETMHTCEIYNKIVFYTKKTIIIEERPLNFYQFTNNTYLQNQFNI